jgi:hypothetical protein
MKLTTTPLLAIVTAAVIIGMVTVSIHQVYAPRTCVGCIEFKKLTHEFEKNVINAIGDPGISPQPRELLVGYVGDVNTIFVGDPNIDQVRTLLQSYNQDVTTIFEQNPPDGDKQLVKEFKGITKDFVKAVIGAVSPPEPDKQ